LEPGVNPTYDHKLQCQPSKKKLVMQQVDKCILLSFLKTHYPTYYNAIVVVVNAAVMGLAPEI
jgi:hypothetical protein